MTITETMWEIIAENDELPAELTSIMRKEYEPFLTHEKATYVNTSTLEHSVREELMHWYEWLPDTAVSHIGGELAMEAFHAAGSVLDEDGKGGYCFDRMTFKDPFDILGFFLGYMSGPIMAESREGCEERQKRVVILPEVASPTGIAL